MLIAQVRTMLKGCGSHATQLGYHKKVAVPMTEVEMQLLQRMHKTCISCSTASHQHTLLLRHGMLFSLLWQSCLRGFNESGRSYTRSENMLKYWAKSKFLLYTMLQPFKLTTHDDCKIVCCPVQAGMQVVLARSSFFFRKGRSHSNDANEG